jgi:hypothetical protein
MANTTVPSHAQGDNFNEVNSRIHCNRLANILSAFIVSGLILSVNDVACFKGMRKSAQNVIRFTSLVAKVVNGDLRNVEQMPEQQTEMVSVPRHALARDWDRREAVVTLG